MSTISIYSIYKSNGHILGFIKDENLYSQFGQYLGWTENGHVWDSKGQFRGKVTKAENGHFYILRYVFDLSPIPQSPRIMGDLNPSEMSNIAPIIAPIVLQIGYIDGF
jgi:hypothetical protein